MSTNWECSKRGNCVCPSPAQKDACPNRLGCVPTSTPETEPAPTPMPVPESHHITRFDVLSEAAKVVSARGVKYGVPEENFARIARHWRVYFHNRFGVSLNLGSRDVALLMDLMKTSRLENNIGHHDSWVDKVGYAACGAAIEEEPEEPMVVTDG
jgi:uncharacterized protein DUF6378